MSGIVVRPGDTVLIALDSETSPEVVADFAERMKERLPGCQFVLVAGARAFAAYRPDGDADE